MFSFYDMNNLGCKSWVYTSGFRMRLPHCFAFFNNLPWFCSIKVSYKKSQRNAENTCGNRMCKVCKLSLKVGWRDTNSRNPFFLAFQFPNWSFKVTTRQSTPLCLQKRGFKRMSRNKLCFAFILLLSKSNEKLLKL